MSFVFNFGLPGLMSALSAEQRALLDGLGVRQSYRHKQHIQSRGDQNKGFSIIKEGAVCFGKTDRDGRFIALAVLEAGQYYGEFTVFGGLPRSHDAHAQGDTVVSHISKARFDQLLIDRPDLALPIIRLLTLRLYHSLEWMDDVRRYPLKYRLGKTLLSMAQEEGDATIKVTQAELADLLGVSRVAVAQTLADYRRRGFVQSVYGGVKLIDLQAFRDWLRAFVTLEPVT
ncbi:MULTISPECIES: Crp/Fnr family transcriptional regulator [Kordiimonas]|jgi:CRP-like cAMP-binding protein|uniref:Crp/Fnr family transcriptional regulator n=1 Tax=Kordiimonas TaxID=288021 RepID=UPI00257D324A|nr:Crp/Fnr family transcriptional regulator [Kordiimonas sp. UBA4487]